MKNALLSILFFFASLSMQAQFNQDIEYIVITKSSGEKIKGIFKEMTSTEIIYFLNGTYHTINRDDVEKFEIRDWLIEGDNSVGRNKNYSDQYTLFQSALPAGQGNYYYRNYDLIVNQFTLGISENFTLSGGFEALSLFIDEGAPVFFITPKFSFGQENIHLGISTSAFFNGSDYIGLASANTTIGDRKNNFTFGLSLGYGNNDIGDEVIIHLNGMVTISKRLSLISEIMLVDEFGVVLFDFGIRIIADNGIGFDASLLSVGDADSIIPILGLTIPMGQKSN